MSERSYLLHNDIFEELTANNPNNLLGLLAYGIYREDKIKFIQDCIDKNPNHTSPTTEELVVFNELALKKSDYYTHLAQEKLSNILDELLRSNLEAYKHAAKEAQKEAAYELQQEKSCPREYNFIFEKLTGKDINNILGLIAYGIYKNDKINFIEKQKRKNPDKNGPTNDEINQFHDFTMDQIQHYTDLAQAQMTKFMDELVTTNMESYKQAEKDAQKEAWSELIEGQKDGFEKVISTCQADVGKLQSSWRTYAWSGVVGNAAFLVFLAGLFLILGLFGNDLAGRIIAWVRGIV